MTQRIYNVVIEKPNAQKLFSVHQNLVFECSEPDLPEYVDLRDKCPRVYDQGPLGACTGFASAKGLREMLDIICRRPHVEFSALFSYWNGRVKDGHADYDSGAYIIDSMRVLYNQGACPEKLHPYEIEDFREKPSDTAYQTAVNYRVLSTSHLPSMVDILKCLASGFPVAGGIAVFTGDNGLEGKQVKRTGKVYMPDYNDHNIGGHAVLLVGYHLSKEYFIVRNSWGPDWGDSGYFYLPFDYVRAFSDPATVGDWWTARI